MTERKAIGLARRPVHAARDHRATPQDGAGPGLERAAAGPRDDLRARLVRLYASRAPRSIDRLKTAVTGKATSLARRLENAARGHRVNLRAGAIPNGRRSGGTLGEDFQAQIYELYASKTPGFVERLEAAVALSSTDRAALVREAALYDAAAMSDPASRELATEFREIELPEAELKARLGDLQDEEALLAVYFSAAAAAFRFRLRSALREHSSVDLSQGALLCQLARFEPDLLLSLSQAAEAQNSTSLALDCLSAIPTFHGQGRVFYLLVDLCIRARISGPGGELARAARRFFEVQDQPFKSSEFVFKGGVLAEQLNDNTRAVAHYRGIVETGEEPLLLPALYRFIAILRVKDRPERHAEVIDALYRNRPGALCKAYARLLRDTGGGGDWIQNVMHEVLADSVARLDSDQVRLPTDLIGDPLALTAALGRVAARLQASPEMEETSLRMTALASEFQNLGASGALFARQLRTGDSGELDGAMAYIRSRFGLPFLTRFGLLDLAAERRDTTFIVVTARNVGDSALYIASAVRLAELSPHEVVVLHYASRQPIVDLYEGARNVRFVVMPNEVEAPLPLRLARVEPGSVSAFYAHDWWSDFSIGKLADPFQFQNYLLHKLALVLLSAGSLVPAPVELAFSAPPPKAEHRRRSDQIFHDLGLVAGRTVLVAPLANALFREETSFARFERFWFDAISLFRANGFAVVVNARNHGPEGGAEPIFQDLDCKLVDLGLDEVASFVERCGYFASVRSGLCDLLALLNPVAECKVIYARDAQLGPGLAHFGINEVVVDFDSEVDPATIFADWLG